MQKTVSFNDPIYGFIHIPNQLILDIIEEPCFQRLRRIHQMGMSFMVFPGAHHTRFEHAIGSMHLMQKAIDVLEQKKVLISEQEKQGLLIAILTHDIGHGPFSHALEGEFTTYSHEELSIQILQTLNKKYNGALSIAIEMLQSTYAKKFCNQLISGQLDMDRLDYLGRDSFYTAVPEGTINADRIISMLNVIDNELVLDEKGIYSIESFLLARRFMYWQVYYHKVSIVTERLLVNVFRRARDLNETNPLPRNQMVDLLLCGDNKLSIESFLEIFYQIDDHDVMHQIKQWQYDIDPVLSKISKMLINRKLLQIKITNKPMTVNQWNDTLKRTQRLLGVTDQQIDYFSHQGVINNLMYNPDKDPIQIWNHTNLCEITEISDNLSVKAFSGMVTKYYTIFSKEH